MKKKWISALVMACAIALVIGCSNGSDERSPIAVESITLDAETLTLAPGATEKLTATVKPDNADDKTVTWKSSDEKVATIKDGTVTAVAEGTATITARAGSKEATCVVTVKAETDTVANGAVESITLDMDTLTLEVGKTEKVTATVTPDNADDKAVKWSSSDTAIVTVDNDGTIMAVKEGKATITAQVGDKKAKCEITVKSNSSITHVHYYTLGICTVCGFQKPFMLDGTIDDNGILTNYHGAEATVTIPDGVIGIGGGAFENCGSLKKVVIPGSVTAIGSQAFKGCSNLNTLEISTGLTGIGSYAFDGCTSLRNVSIPDSVTSIGDSAFSGCTKLTSVTIPTSVTSFGDYAFEKCESLATVRYGGTLAQWCAQVCAYNLMSYAKSVILTGENDLDLKAVTTLKIPDGVTIIENYAFFGCKNLVNVIIPTSVTKIGISTFYLCENLATVRYNGTLVQWCAFDNGGDLGSYAKSVILTGENNLDLKAVTTLTIPDGVASIGGYAFNGCTGLTSVSIPNGVISISNGAFGGTGLISVSIPNSVTSIGLGAFSRCTGLTSVTIPNSVTSIDYLAFFLCENLMSVNYNGTKEGWSAIKKASDWDWNTGNYTITCTDGTIAKQ